MSTRTRIGIAALCLAVALLAGAASGLGVFQRGDGSKASTTSIRGEEWEYVTTGIYRYNAERVVAEGVGWDVVTLFLVVPAMLATLPFLVRGSLRGRLVAAGLLGYFFYQYLMYALMWAFGPLFVPFVLIYSASLCGIIWIATTMRMEELTAEFAASTPRRSFAAFTFLMALMLTGMWGSRIAAGLGGDLVAAGMYGMPTMVVQALDLGMIVPLSVLTGVLVLKRSPWGYLLASIFSVKGFALATGIVAMLISAWMVEGKLDVGGTIAFASAALVSLGLAVRMYVPRRAAVMAVPAEGEVA